MNLSGQAIDFLAGRFGAPPQDQMLVVVDDMSLPLGQLRLRKRGSSGGHNGLKSIEQLLGNPDYPRLRLGIGQPPSGVEVVDYVLSPFQTDESATVKAVIVFAAQKVAEWADGVSFEGLVGKVNGWRPSDDANFRPDP
jgi:PTH1 family peptidyl-tRNA hydrolase